MKKYFNGGAILILIAFLLSGNHSWAQTIDLEKEKTAILKAEHEMASAAKSNDLERLWNFWDEEAIILLSVEKTVSGINEIKAFTTNSRKDPNFMITWEPHGVGVSPSAEMGYTYGVGSMTRTQQNGQPITITRPYVVVWKKNAMGEWKVLIDRP